MRPAALRRKPISAACIQDLVLSIMTTDAAVIVRRFSGHRGDELAASKSLFKEAARVQPLWLSDNLRMKLSLLLLLVLSSVSLQAVLEKSSQPKNVSLLNPDLDLTANKSTLTHRRFLPSANLKHKRQARSPKSAYVAKLKWKMWMSGRPLPEGRVSIYNDYVKRTDYVCQLNCQAGFYNPEIGPYCNIPFANKEIQAPIFMFLVNEDNFEYLKWEDDWFGNVPSYAIKTCPDKDMYVGKNQYGLGKVHASHKCFYLPWEGSEIWYRSYKVLTISRDIESEHVYNVQYNKGASSIIKYPPENLHVTTLKNYQCQPVKKVTTLSKKVNVEKRWDITNSMSVGSTNTISAGVPFVTSGSIDISTTVSVKFSVGQTHTEENTMSTTVEYNIPPNHSCKARMVGHKYKINVPFTAQLRRTYRNGAIRKTSTSGTFYAIQVAVHSEVDRCEPLPDSKPCLEN